MRMNKETLIHRNAHWSSSVANVLTELPHDLSGKFPELN